MTYRRNQNARTRRSAAFLPLGIVLLSLTLVLTACAPQPTSSGAGRTTRSGASTTTLAATQLPSNGQPTPVFSGNTGTPLVQSYHTVLMFERAADLMLAVVQKIQAGTINPSDMSVIAPYVGAFPLAVEEFNRVRRPPELMDIWNHVENTAQLYDEAYILLTGQQSLSSQDLKVLKASRGMLATDRSMIEKYMAPNGNASDLVAAQEQLVSAHLQQRYGSQPVPTLEP